MNLKINSNISEIAGFFAADGSMQKNHICFWGNIEADRDYYDIRLKKLFLDEFGISINPHEKRSNSVYGFYVCNRQIIDYFSKVLGFLFGEKTNSVMIPEIIMKSSDENKLAFIRGFLAGDGCLNFDKRYAKDQEILKIIHTYPRIQIKSVSERIISQISEILNENGIRNFISLKKSKKNNEKDSYMLQVSGVKMMGVWESLIGFSNPNHSTKCEIFKKHGFVPSHTAYRDRLAILDGVLDPWSFYPLRTCSLVWIRRQKDS